MKRNRHNKPLPNLLKLATDFFLWCLSRLYCTGQSLDSWRHDTHWLKTQKVSVPVVSVGNLVAGGTGKTVFVDYLLEHFKNHGPLGVACRGYRPFKDAWNDEMVILKNHHPDMMIEADTSRHQAARRLIDQGCRLIFLDDGFQHRRLHRDLDIVLLDATDPFSKGWLPHGRRRESVQALKRAHLLILSHADCLPPQERENLRKFLNHQFGKPVLMGHHQVMPPVCLESGASLPPGPIHLLAGVAQPHHVISSLKELGYEIRATTFPGDHLPPDSSQLKNLLKSPWPVICTEKDWVKQTPSRPWFVAKVKWKFMNHCLTLDQMIQEVIT